MPRGKSTVRSCRLFSRAPTTRSARPGRAGRRDDGTGDATDAGEILAGEALRPGNDLLGRAAGDDLAAVHAGSGTHVDQVVGRPDRLLVMLDDDHRVAEIAKALQRLEQAAVVALVEADGRLVEDVEDAGQARADLRGETDALAFAARKRAGGARQGQILQADVPQETEALVDLAQYPARNLLLLRVQRRTEPGEPRRSGVDGHLGHGADVETGDLDRQRFRLEPLAAAGVARGHGLVAAQLFADPRRLGLAPAPLHVRHDPLERLAHLVGAHAVVVAHGDGFAA